jgi:branched-chain amino acid transport system substrate-binding protein
MTEAIIHVLRQRGFEAGPFRVGYQACDDSTETGFVGEAKCSGNAGAYAVTPALIGIIGTFNSSCAAVLLPVVNQAVGGPIPMISPANTYAGLTRSGPGTFSGDPAGYYPTGIRNYVRVTAPDPVQAAANAQWTKLRNRKRVFILTDGSTYGLGQAADYSYAAKRLGLKVVGFKSHSYFSGRKSYVGLAKQIKRTGANAAYLAESVGFDGGKLIRDLRSVLGPRVILLAPDGYMPVDGWIRGNEFADGAGAAANGTYISIAGPSMSKLPAAGKQFVTAFGASVGAPVDPYSVYAAQSADILLSAIAASDGSRKSVLERLFATKVENGIMGTFGFDKNGDQDPGQISIYQVQRGKQHEVTVLQPSSALVRPG